MKSHEYEQDRNLRILTVNLVIYHLFEDKQGMSLEGLSLASLDLSLKKNGDNKIKEYNVFIWNFSKITMASSW